jgi:glycosyltransferase involved in cell wall biosynthesis
VARRGGRQRRGDLIFVVRLVKVLFINQGRARSGSALGLIRVQQAIELGFPAAERDRIRLAFSIVPPFNAWQRVLTHRVPKTGWNDLLALRWHLMRSWLGRRAFARGVDAEAPDVVHISTVQVAMLLGRRLRHRPSVVAIDVPMTEWTKRQQGLEFDDPTPVNLRPLRALERRALEQAPRCVAWTETAAARARAIAPRADVRALHPGIDLDEFRPRDGDREEGPTRVLFVGGRWRDKGGPDLLEAIGDELGRSIVLDVVSPDPEVPTRPGITVHDTSAPGSPGTAELFRAADVLCLPTRLDGAPLVVVEALASGVPVISTPVGSIPELVGDCGEIVGVGDVPALAAAIRRLEDPARRDELSHRARARAEELYDARRNTPVLLRILEEAATEPARGRA